MNEDEIAPIKKTALVVVDDESFRENCKLLEDELAADMSETKEDIGKLESWLHWVENNLEQTSRVDYFYKTAIPRITRVVLQRMYPDPLQQIPPILEFFKHNLLKTLLHKPFLTPTHTPLMDTLFLVLNPTQTIYSYKLETDIDMEETDESTDEVEFQLESKLDVKDDEGEWQAGHVTEISPTQTELKIQYQKEDGQVFEKWVSTEGKEIAPHATKSCTQSTSGASDTDMASDNQDDENDGWKDQVRPGSIVDVRLKNGEWFEALVIAEEKICGERKIYVAFFGLYPEHDTWLYLHDKRLAPRGQKAKGKRGHTVTRFDLHEQIDDSNDEKGDYACTRPQLNTAKSFVELVNIFGNYGGFQAILEKFQSESTPSLYTCTACISMLANVSPWLNRHFLDEFCAPFKDSLQGIAENIGEVELRAMGSDTLEVLHSSLLKFLFRWKSDDNVAEFTEKLCLKIASICLKSSIFEHRLYGLKYLTETISMIKNSEAYPCGLKLVTCAPTRQYPLTNQIVEIPVTRWLNQSYFAQWCKETNVIENIFCGLLAHEQLILRASDLVKFLCNTEAFNIGELEAIWEVVARGVTELRSSTIKVIEESVPSMNEVICGKLLSLVMTELTASKNPSLLRIANAISKHAPRQLSEDNSSFEKAFPLRFQSLNFMWLLLLKSTEFDKNTHENIRHHLEDGIRFNSETELSETFITLLYHFIDNSVELIEKHENVPQALSMIYFMISLLNETLQLSSIKVSIMEYLMSEKKIIEKFLKEIANFKGMCSDMLKKGEVTVDTLDNYVSQLGDHRSYIENISERLNFLSLLLNNSGERNLSHEEISLLWNCFVLEAISPQERQEMFTWLIKCTNYDPSGLMVFDDHTVNFTFHNLLCDFEFLDSDMLTPLGFTCYQRYFLIVNHFKKSVSLLGYDPNIQFMICAPSPEIDGFDILWHILLNAKNNDVFSCVNQFLTLLPHKVSPRLDFQAYSIECIKSGLEYVKKASEETHIRRGLIALKGFIETSELFAHSLADSSCIPHSSSARGSKIRLWINNNVKSSCLYGKRIQFFAHEKDTLWEMEVAIGLQIQAPFSARFLRFFHAGREIQDHLKGSSLQEIGIKEGDAILVAAHASDNITSSSRENAEEIIGDNLYDLLFELIDSEKSELVASESWALLMRLPTCERVKQNLLNSVKDGNWNDTLYQTSDGKYSNLLYSLQILVSLFCDGNYLTSDHLDQFMKGGGIEWMMHLVKLCGGDNKESDISSYNLHHKLQCLQAAIQIIHSVAQFDMSVKRSDLYKVISIVDSNEMIEIFQFDNEVLEGSGKAMQELILRSANSLVSSSIFDGQLQLVSDIELYQLDLTSIQDILPHVIEFSLHKFNELEDESVCDTIFEFAIRLWTMCYLFCDQSAESMNFLMPILQSAICSSVRGKKSLRVRAIGSQVLFVLCLNKRDFEQGLLTIDTQKSEKFASYLVPFIHATLQQSEEHCFDSLSTQCFTIIGILIASCDTTSLKTGDGESHEENNTKKMKMKEFTEFQKNPEEFLTTCVQFLQKHHKADFDSIDEEAPLYTAVYGLFFLMKTLFETYPNLKLNKDSLIDELWKTCLFLYPGESEQQEIPSICKMHKFRVCTYQILAELIDSGGHFDSSLSSNLNHIIELVMSELSKVPKEQRNIEWQWMWDPVYQAKSYTGYVGLRNLGCTCYMNSTLQQLFMIKKVRNAIMSYKIDSNKNVPADREVVINELQKLFYALQYSSRKSYDTFNFCKSLKDENNHPINVMMQQDAEEYFTRVCDQLHEVTKLNGSSAIRESLGGTICTQLLCQGGCNTTRETQEENFVCMTVEVKGYSSLEQSLAQQCEGELLNGVNCDVCGGKKDTIKRDCVGVLPPVLVLHLKRFELNFDTFLREKVNDEFAFPLSIDMHPYTKAGLLEGGDKNNSNSGSFIYQLTGCVIHQGSTDSGHYYSLAFDRASGKWLELNDEKVSYFDISNLEKECFGGIDQNTGQYVNRNAYMLIYEKINCEKELNQEIVADNLNLPAFQWVHKDNILFSNNYYLLQKPFGVFIGDILKSVTAAFENSCAKSSVDSSNEQLLKFLECSFEASLLLAHSSCEPYAVINIIRSMEGIASTVSIAKKTLAHYIGKDPVGVINFVIHCPKKGIRVAVLEMLSSLISYLTDEESDLVLSYCKEEFPPPFTTIDNHALLNDESLSVRIVKTIASQSTFDELASFWRNAIDFVTFLHSFVRKGPTQLQLMVSSRLVMYLVDYILGEMSPLFGKYYNVHSRKRVPEAVVDYKVYDQKMEGTSFSAITVETLKVVSYIVCHCDTDKKSTASGLKLDELSRVCILSKQFYIQSLSNPFNTCPIRDIIVHWSFEWKAYSKSVIDLICEMIDRIEEYSTPSLVAILEEFIKLDDSLAEYRAKALFSHEESSNVWNVISKKIKHDSHGMTQLLCAIFELAKIETIGLILAESAEIWYLWVVKLLQQQLSYADETLSHDIRKTLTTINSIVEIYEEKNWESEGTENEQESNKDSSSVWEEGLD